VTAAQLNRLYGGYIAAPGHLTLSDLLEGVRTYAIEKFYRDPDKEDISQECVKQVWRSVDTTCIKPLKLFSQNSSFSTWISKTCVATRMNYVRDQGQKEEPTDDNGLERLTNQDPWHSEGRRKVGPLPTEGYYYEKPDPNCKIPLGKSAWEE
jgi:DNA-directed RNA polymerase specialized sigma24 family protein